MGAAVTLAMMREAVLRNVLAVGVANMVIEIILIQYLRLCRVLPPVVYSFYIIFDK